MAESTLSLSWTEYMNAIALALRYGVETDPSSPTTWTSEQVTALNGYVNDGYRDVLTCRGQDEGYAWSFSRVSTSMIAWATTTGTISGTPAYVSPSSTVTATAASFHPAMVSHNFVPDTSGTEYPITAVNSTTEIVVTGDASGDADDTFTITADGNYDLPDDFAAMCGSLTFETATAYEPIHLCSELELRTLRQSALSTSRPRRAAARWKSGAGTTGQRAELLLWPIPDGDYTLYYMYDISPAKLSSSSLYPLGGMRLGAAIRLAGIHAALEAHRDDGTADAWGAFQTALSAAIEADARSVRADNLGRSAGWSRATGTSRAGLRYDAGILGTYNGATSP